MYLAWQTTGINVTRKYCDAISSIRQIECIVVHILFSRGQAINQLVATRSGCLSLRVGRGRWGGGGVEAGGGRALQ